MGMSPIGAALAKLLHWQNEALPTVSPAPEREFVIWLLENGEEPCPMGDVYRAARSSEPKVREVVRGFAQRGLVEILADPEDSRRSLIRATDKFRELARQYMALMRQVVLDLDGQAD